MSLTVQRSIAWLLIVLLTIMWGVGEGLHWIPGCGHGVPVGNGILLLGINVPEGQRPADGHPHVECPHGQDIPLCDEDQCAICSAVGQIGTLADSAQSVLVLPLVHELPVLVFCDIPAATAHPFQTRAPPLV